MFDYGNVSQDPACPAIQLDDPPRGSGWLIQRSHARPECAVEPKGERVGAAEVRDLTKEFAFEVELLDAPVLAVGDVEDVVLIDHNGVGKVELAAVGAGRSHVLTSLPWAVYSSTRALPYPSLMKMRPCGAKVMSVVPLKGLGDVRLAADLDPLQLLAVGGVLDDAGAGSIDGPDVAGGVEAYGVRDGVEAFTEGVEDAALGVDGHDRIGLVAALDQPEDIATGSARNPGDFAEFLTCGELNGKIVRSERKAGVTIR